MKNPISRSTPLKTEFLVSCYNTPSETVRRLFYVVVRAGHLRSAPDYRIDRDHLPGHDLLLCLSGSGFVLSNNRRFKVEPNELAWISGYHPHAHWANPADPWELLWVRIDGRAIERHATYSRCFGFLYLPRFRFILCVESFAGSSV